MSDMNGVPREDVPPKLAEGGPTYDKDQQDAINAIEALLKEARAGNVRAVAFVAVAGPMGFNTSFAGTYHAEQFFGAKLIGQHTWAMMQGIHPSQIAARQAEAQAKQARIWRPGMPGPIPPGMKF